MNIKTIITLLLFPMSIQLFAQEVSMRTIFVNMPDTLLPYMSSGNKLDLIDFAESGMEAQVNDNLGDSVTLTKLTHDYLYLRLSPSSSVELKILPYHGNSFRDSLIICMVSSVGSDIKESSVQFYTTGWKSMKSLVPIKFEISNFMVEDHTVSDERLRILTDKLCPFMVSANLSPETTDLILKLSIPRLTEEDKGEIGSLFIPKTLKWNGNTFK